MIVDSLRSVIGEALTLELVLKQLTVKDDRCLQDRLEYGCQQAQIEQQRSANGIDFNM